MEEYRPISLLNCSYKIITKILTSRLNEVISELIGGYQSAFIKKRYIMDSMVCAHELLYNVKMKREGLMLKLDFEKAYDNVR